MAVTTAAVAHPVRPATDHLRIAAPAQTVPAQTAHRASDHHRQIARKGIAAHRVPTGRMCPIDRHNRHNRLVKGSNCAKSAVPVIRAPTAIARTVIDRRVGIDHKGIEHRDRAEIGRLCGPSSATPSRWIVHSNPVRHKSPVRAMAPTIFRCHRPHQQPVATPSR
jgi:hypothetical protein